MSAGSDFLRPRLQLGSSPIDQDECAKRPQSIFEDTPFAFCLFPPTPAKTSFLCLGGFLRYPS